jgi:hypothetical protein
MEKYARVHAHPTQLSFKALCIEQERNLKLLFSEVCICSKTGSVIEEIHNADVNAMHLRIWQAGCKQRQGFKDPPTDQRPTAAKILKDWIKDLE